MTQRKGFRWYTGVIGRGVLAYVYAPDLRSALSLFPSGVFAIMWGRVREAEERYWFKTVTILAISARRDGESEVGDEQIFAVSYTSQARRLAWDTSRTPLAMFYSGHTETLWLRGVGPINRRSL